MKERLQRNIAVLAMAVWLASPSYLHTQSLGVWQGSPKVLLRASDTLENWDDLAEPTRIVGPIYFVGTAGLGVWLITSSEGNILLNTGTQHSGPMIEASIRKLGLKPGDLKILLIGHAHFDHAGGLAYMKKVSGGQVAVIDREVDLVESGGKKDFQYGQRSEFWFDPVKVDRVVRDGDNIKLGEIVLTAHLTPGHTKGTTTWTTTVVDGGKSYSVVFPDGTSVNPGYRVGKNPSYPGIADDYRQTFSVLESLKPDIWLAPHLPTFDFDGKRARTAKEGVRAWVDPDGYRKLVAVQRGKFEAALGEDNGVPANAP